MASKVWVLGAALAGFLSIVPGVFPQGRPEALQVTFDDSGVSSLSYQGVSLIDLKAKRGDAFAVGSYRLGEHNGYGAAEKQARWDASSKTVTWSLPWGSVTCQFAVAGERLDIRIAIRNTSREELSGITIYPLGLQFPDLPRGFGAANYPQFHNNLDGPNVIVADYQKGAVAFVDASAQPLYLGLTPSGAANHYQMQLGTINDSSQGFLAKAVPVHRTIGAGKTDSYAVSLRFAAAGTTVETAAGDLLQAYARAWPQLLQWPDRRPIGELFLSDPTQTPVPDARPNARNYNFVKGQPNFREAALAYADRAVRLLKSMNAQGAIVWDLEGQQFPQPDPSYAGDPTKLGKLSPEMEEVADAFFKRFTDAGLKCGLTIRPQDLDMGVSPPHQKDLAAEQQIDNLTRKMRYAKKRWGCSIFYVDSDGGPNDATAPSVFADVLKAVPGVLIIPENIWIKDYAYTAPLASFTAPYKPLHTPGGVRAIWPQAFTVTYVGDVPGGDLRKDPALWQRFQEAAKAGDILSFRAWFDDQPVNGQVRELTATAAK